MKRILILLALIVVGVSSAQAQTKEFLELFNKVRTNVQRAAEYNYSYYDGFEVAQYPADMLRTMGLKDPINGRNVLNNLRVIYQVKISSMSKTKQYANSVYRQFDNLTDASRKPRLYEQYMCQTAKNKEVRVYKAIKRKNSPNEYMVLIRDKEKDKAMICDIVGYIDIEDVMTMLSLELKNYANVDSLAIGNK